MKTRTPPPGRPRDDRLERLLRTGGDLPSAEDAKHGGELPDDDWHDEWQDGERHDAVDSWGGGADGERQDASHVERLLRGRHRAERVPLLSVPESLRSSELHVGVRAVRGLLVLAVVAVLVLGGRWLWTQRAAVASPADRVATSSTEEDGPPEAPGQDAPGDGEGGGELGAGEEPDGGAAPVGDAGAARAGGAGPTVSAAADEGSRSNDLVVHVAGEVAEPGVVTVPAGSRVVDAVRAVGGVTEEADQSTLNLARPVVDGERIWVGRPGETPPTAPGPLPDAEGAAGAGGGGASAGGQPVPLDLNAATQADLEELPGVGPVTAGHILSWREEHGRFSSVDELLEVSGIGERTLARLEPLVTVGG